MKVLGVIKILLYVKDGKGSIAVVDELPKGFKVGHSLKQGSKEWKTIGLSMPNPPYTKEYGLTVTGPGYPDVGTCEVETNES